MKWSLNLAPNNLNWISDSIKKEHKHTKEKKTQIIIIIFFSQRTLKRKHYTNTSSVFIEGKTMGKKGDGEIKKGREGGAEK